MDQAQSIRFLSWLADWERNKKMIAAAKNVILSDSQFYLQYKAALQFALDHENFWPI